MLIQLLTLRMPSEGQNSQSQNLDIMTVVFIPVS
jgi:hypothetical protein